MPSFRQCASSILAGLVLGCGGGGGGTPPGPTPSVVEKTSGDAQIGAAGTALGATLVVTVKDASGTPLAGINVAFAAASGGGSVAPTSASTGADGKASTTRTLGPGAGTQTTTATVSGVTPATFSSVATIQGAVTLALSGSAARSDSVKATVPDLVVVVKDQNGAAVSGVTVNWSASGHGHVSQASSPTNGSGLASVSWTFDSIAGTQTAQASVTGLVGSPIVFTGTVGSGAAVSMASAGGNNQLGDTGTALASPLKVKVSDQFGNGVALVTITWASTSDSASVAPPTSQTDASGIAQTVVTVGDTAGPVTLTATNATLTGSPVTFHATVQLPPPVPTTADVTIGDDFFKSVRNNTQNPAVDTIAVGGMVTWTWTGAALHSVQSTGSPSFVSSGTQTTGTYSRTFNSAGTYTYDCAVHGLIMTGRIVVK